MPTDRHEALLELPAILDLKRLIVPKMLRPSMENFAVLESLETGTPTPILRA